MMMTMLLERQLSVVLSQNSILYDSREVRFSFCYTFGAFLDLLLIDYLNSFRMGFLTPRRIVDEPLEDVGEFSVCAAA